MPFRWGQEDEVPLKGLHERSPGPAACSTSIGTANPTCSPSTRSDRRCFCSAAGGEPPAPGRRQSRPARGVTPGGLTVADLNGPALIVAQNTFARNLLLDKQGVWEVKDQYNSGRGSAANPRRRGPGYGRRRHQGDRPARQELEVALIPRAPGQRLSSEWIPANRAHRLSRDARG